jgi:hypothetical protein
MSFQRVAVENFASSISTFINTHSRNVQTYEDILDVYLSMVRGRYVFTIERELLSDMLADMVYCLNPGDEINRVRVLHSLIQDDDEDEDDDDGNIPVPH